ncbi:hypothetical protein [Nostoc sp.]|uniref:hypothetical protein n=1 Tax=Nostoc sp. TaxID=1180 RepID=UPI002FF9CC40
MFIAKVRFNTLKLKKLGRIGADGLDPLSISQQSHRIRGYTDNTHESGFEIPRVQHPLR